MSNADPVAAFAALGDHTRLALLLKLSGGAALSIAALSADARITRQAVTKHLRVLEDAGLVVSERTGRESRYTIRLERVATARDYLSEVAMHWEAALRRLKGFVED